MTTRDILAEPSRVMRFNSQREYQLAVRALIIHRGEKPIKASYNKAGNCTICGEAGRCPGWHTQDDIVSI